MQFLITAHDGTDENALERRTKVREAHIALGNKMRNSKNLLYAVALLNDINEMIGSVCIVDFPSKDEVNQWLKIEPYVTGNVWKQIEIQPCKVGPSFAKGNFLE